MALMEWRIRLQMIPSDVSDQFWRQVFQNIHRKERKYVRESVCVCFRERERERANGWWRERERERWKVESVFFLCECVMGCCIPMVGVQRSVCVCVCDEQCMDVSLCVEREKVKCLPYSRCACVGEWVRERGRKNERQNVRKEDSPTPRFLGVKTFSSMVFPSARNHICTNGLLRREMQFEKRKWLRKKRKPILILITVA